MTVKDSVPALNTVSGAGRPVRHGEAVGAEIPVTVHASRNTRGVGNNLPPVHEETRTVIVLPHGAVVRLTAVLAPGEMVVLSNRQTGADVLCRVRTVKAQPGIQQYVDLEFTQRVPGFWGDCIPEQRAAALDGPAAAPSMPTVATAPAPGPPPRPIMKMPAPIAAASSAALELRPLPLAKSVSVSLSSSEPNPVGPVRPASSGRAPATAADRRATTPRLLLNLTPPDLEGTRAFSGSKKVVLAVAALVLLVAGAAMGGWFYRQGLVSSDAPPPQRAFTSPPDVVAPPVVLPVIPEADPPGTAALNAAPLPATQTEIAIEPLPPVEPPVNRAQTPPVTVARAPRPTPAVRRNSLVIGKLAAPVQKATPATANSDEPPPLVVGAANGLGEMGTGPAFLTTTGADPAPPPAPRPRPAAGGQLQPPRLISSPPPAYPPNARAQRVQGVVVLDALVDETGRIAQTTVIAGPALLQEAAQNALRNWTYQPARLNGQPIAIHTTVNVRFTLN